MKITRRVFLRNAATVGVAAAFPSIVPARVLGKDAPSNTVNVAQIGCGRIGLTMDVPGFLRARGARVVAACDLDSRRLEWDWQKERFVNDAEANAMLERTERAPYGAKRAYERLSKKVVGTSNV